jgi:hypothetical protein
MNAVNESTGHHPAPKAGALGLVEGFFAVFAGPLAWFVQLTAGFALAAQPCFSSSDAHAATRVAAWTEATLIALVIAAGVVALAATFVAWRAYQRAEDEAGGDHRHVMEVGAGRTRFLALWGVILGAGSALATSFTAVAILVLPRCGG